MPGIFSFAKGIREIHDKADVAHRQAHASNYYFAKKPYIVDWTTMKSLGKNPDIRARLRTIDFNRIVGDFIVLFYNIFSHLPYETYKPVKIAATEMLFDVYAGKTSDAVPVQNLSERVKELRKKSIPYIGKIVQWMKKQSLE